MYDFLSPRFAYNNSALNKNVTEMIMKVQKCAVFYLGGGGNNFRNHKLKLGAFIFINKSGLIFFLKVLTTHCVSGYTEALRII